MDTPNTTPISTPTPDLSSADIWSMLRMPRHDKRADPVQNANDIHDKTLSPLDKLAVKITEKVGSMGFFLSILTWTILWCGYNILASQVASLHWKPFDPFPAFVAYLLISNVIQILLMPLIMVGQNVQSRHADIRAELDYQVNMQAEKEVTLMLRHMSHNTDLLIQLMKHLECRVSDDEMRAITAEQELAVKLAEVDPTNGDSTSA